jgi:hypothetical protein
MLLRTEAADENPPALLAHATFSSSNDSRGGAPLRSRVAGSLTVRSGFGVAGCLRDGRRADEGAGRGVLASGPGVGVARRALAQRMSSDRHTMTRPPATGCTTASCPAEYARRKVFIDGQAFERSALSPMRAARA